MTKHRNDVMSEYVKKRIVAWRKSGFRVWAIAENFGITEAEVIELLRSNGFRPSSLTQPWEKKKTPRVAPWGA